MQSISYAHHRFPPEVIQHAIWLYVRFTLSYRDVEELLAERGLDVIRSAARSRLSASPMVVAVGTAPRLALHLLFVLPLLPLAFDLASISRAHLHFPVAIPTAAVASFSDFGRLITVAPFAFAALPRIG
jgi:hypothetical protein